MKKPFRIKAVLIILALSSMVFHLYPATAASAAEVVTCVDLNSGKERIAKAGTCRATSEAMAKWHLAPTDSALASGGATKTLNTCSNKKSSSAPYQIIRNSCYRHMQTNLYTRSSALPAKPVITGVSSSSSESASLALASDLTSNVDAPIAYYTITSSKGDVKKVNSWRELIVTVHGLHSSTSYTFTITATSADGTSSISASSLPVTTQRYIAPAVAVTTAPVVLCANGGACAVGDSGPGGGKIFYVATSPFACGPSRASTCTYLESAPSLWNGGAADPTRRWATAAFDSVDVLNTSSPETATATGIGWGYRNTRAIVLQGNDSAATSAAALADAYSATLSGRVYEDWYLPSKDEIFELCQQRVIVGGFVEDWYWSSTEAWSMLATPKYFSNSSNGDEFKFRDYSVRPIRAF